MNSVQARGFLAAAAACGPGTYAGPLALVDAVAKAAPDAEWQTAVSGGSASALRLGLLACGRLDGARTALARVLPLAERALEGPPARTRPWIDAAWDARRGAWTGVSIARAGTDGDFLRVLAPKPGPERIVASRRFSPAAFDEPVASALKAFHALEPIASAQTVRGRPGWSLVLARPVPWPRFLRCDVSAAFAPRAAQLALLLRDARVAALDFDGTALWARCLG